jgi:hypothetical protein
MHQRLCSERDAMSDWLQTTNVWRRKTRSPRRIAVTKKCCPWPVNGVMGRDTASFREGGEREKMDTLLSVVQCIFIVIAALTVIGGAPQGALFYGGIAGASIYFAAWWPLLVGMAVGIFLRRLFGMGRA